MPRMAKSRFSKPNSLFVSRNNGTVLYGMLIHGDDFRIREERKRPGIGGRQIAAHHERRAEHAPESEQGALLLVGEASVARLAPAGSGAEMAERKHVCIGPMARLGEWGPFSGAGKLVADTLRIFGSAMPKIPDVVGDAPHLRVTAQFGDFIHGRFAGRKTEDDGPAGLAHREAEHANFVALVRMAGDAIRFDEVHAPIGIKLSNRVVIGLAGVTRGHAEIVGIPGAEIGFVRGVAG